MRTYGELVDWIEKNVPPEKWGTDSTHEAALWWCANQIANRMIEDGRRAMADIVLCGMEALDTEGVTDELDTYYAETEPADYDEITKGIINDLRDWFGLSV